MSKDKEEIWERQPGESTQAFEAFRTYRDLGLNHDTGGIREGLHDRFIKDFLPSRRY